MSTTAHDVFEGLEPQALAARNTPDTRPPTTQAERIIKKFGNARRLADILNLDPSTIYRWQMPESKGGTDGRVPSDKLQKIMDCARLHGVLLTDDDVSPRRLPRPWVRNAEVK